MLNILGPLLISHCYYNGDVATVALSAPQGIHIELPITTYVALRESNPGLPELICQDGFEY